MTTNIKLLIVDDDPTVGKFLVDIIRFLWGSQVDIQTANDGQEGLRKSLEYYPDVIITDMEMPKMHGTEMVRRLRQDPVGNEVQILGMSGSDPSEPTVIDNLGLFDAFLSKPFSWTELRDKLQTLCPKLGPV